MMVKRGRSRSKRSGGEDIASTHQHAEGINIITIHAEDVASSSNCSSSAVVQLTDNGLASPMYEKKNIGDISSKRGNRSRKNSAPRCQFQWSMYIMLATITVFAEAVKHAAFISRDGHSAWALRSVSNKVEQTRIFGFLSQSNVVLRMSDIEVQTPSSGSGTVNDESEWRTLLSAFQMYKAAYGDLKVPSRFVVPEMAPWPESAWKMKLGQRVAGIRSTGKYVQNNETRRKMLDDMGFLWRLRSSSPGKKLDGIAFEQVYDALKMYREQVQPDGKKLEVPPNYIVPDCEPWPDSTRGLPLGKIMPTVRSKTYLKQHPDALKKFISLGFQPDVKAAAYDLRYQRVYDALVKYKELYGDLLVPQPFTVPEDGNEWPEEVRGLRLGARVNAIRSQGTFVKSNPSRKDELDALGFVWEPPANADGRRRGRKRKDETEEAPTNDDTELSVSPAPVSAFDSIRDPFFTGDQSSPPQWAFEGEDDEDALMEQQREEDRYSAPKSFNETLEEMAEMAISVGIMEKWTPNKRVVKGTRDKFVPWRNDDFGSDWVFGDVVEALVLYKDLNGSFDGIEEKEFVVPEPVEESLRLSPFELAVLNDDVPENLDDLDTPWGEDDSEDSLESKFSVTASNDWPEHLAGMKLGQIVSRIREGGLEVKHLPERKAYLDEIGFEWGDPKRFVDVPFEKVMCALYAYFMIRGNTLVPPDFTMPDEKPWPIILQGFEVGKAVTRLRELQNFLEAYHPVKMSLLRMVDFSFFPELALPIDPDVDELSKDHLYVETFGHPLYERPVPPDLPERLLADGPNGPPEKLSSWYNYEYIREIYESKPGAVYGVADYMRLLGFRQLADEHEQKYGPSRGRSVALLFDKLENNEISKEEVVAELMRIGKERKAEINSWKEGRLDEQPTMNWRPTALQYVWKEGRVDEYLNDLHDGEFDDDLVE